MKKAHSRLTLVNLVHPKTGDIRVARDSGQPCHGDSLLGPGRAVTRSGPCVSNQKHIQHMKDTLNAIMPVEQTSKGQPTVNARDLHGFLNIGKDFSNWIKGQIQDWGFVEGQDYLAEEGLSSPKSASSKSRPQKIIEYHLSLDMAKELSMVSRNARGREARRYFIECEKRLRLGEEAFSSLSVESLMRELQRRINGPGFLSELARRALPLGEYGENGKCGFRRATWTRSKGRILEAAKLATQLQLFELLNDDSLSLA